jgi:prepilin-type processing-associated H-X9-DG protein
MELLVVIAIIAVLSAILFPVFAMVRHKARRTTCQSNLNQIGQAIKLYADDNNGYLPSFSQSHPFWECGLTDPQKNAPQPGVVTWDISAQPYLKNTQVLRCPDNPFGRDRRAFAITAYCMKHVPDRNTGFIWYLGERVDNIANHTQVIFLFEKGQNLPGSWGDAMGENVRQSHGSNDQAGYSAETFHMSGKNFLYVDGHVKWFKEETGPFVTPSGSPTPPPYQTTEPGQCYYPDRKADRGDWPDAG